jgi:Zn-dependent protease
VGLAPKDIAREWDDLLHRYGPRHPRRDAAIISLAGPISNILLAIVSSLIIRFLPLIPLPFLISTLIEVFFSSLLVTNVVLAVFNLVPVHPLDGFKIVGGILPEDAARQWQELQSYGYMFLLFLLLPIFGTSPIHNLISPVINLLLSLLIPHAPTI